MKRFVQLALVGALVFGMSSVVYANVCAFDPVPAASLLFPYVVFDYNNPGGPGMTAGDTTLFAITNVSDEAIIVHMTFWTDWSNPVLDFNILLSGYDLHTMNVRDLLNPAAGGNPAFGELPDTYNHFDEVDGGIPLSDGPVSEFTYATWLSGEMLDAGGTDDTDIPPAPGVYSCQYLNAVNAAATGHPESYGDGLPESATTLLETYLTTLQNTDRYHHDCTGNWYYTNDNFEEHDATEPTWFYVTADVVYRCNREFPNSATYWTADITSYDNVIIGDMFYLNDAAQASEAVHAVHLEADEDLAMVATLNDLGGPISFYHRYTYNLATISDFREPLPTAWALRYIGYDAPGISTKFRVFKQATFEFATVWDLLPWTEFDQFGATGNPNVLFDVGAADCMAYTYYAWGDDEEVITPGEIDPWSGLECAPGEPCEGVYPNLLPLETQEIEVEWFQVPEGEVEGWMLFVWPNSNFDMIDGVDRLAADWYQTYMGIKYEAFGMFSAAIDGTVLGNFNCFSDQVLDGGDLLGKAPPVLGVNYDYVDAVGYVSSPAYAGVDPDPLTK